METKLIIKIVNLVIVHILLQLYALFSDGYVVYERISKDEKTYAYWMLGSYCIPGVLQLINWTWTFAIGKCSKKEYLFWFMFSLGFPIFVVGWSFYYGIKALVQGIDHFKKVETQTKVLNSINSMTKSPAQVIIQCTVILLEWKHEDGSMHTKHISSLLVHLFLIVFHMTEHRCFEVEGKDLAEKFYNASQVLYIFKFNLVHFFVRTCCISFLLMYLRYFFIISIAAFTVANFFTAKFTLSKLSLKNIFTAFSGIFLPGSAFFSKDDWVSAKDTNKKFEKYSKINSIWFVVMVMLSLVCVIIISFVKPDFFDMQPQECHMQPPFHRNDECKIEQPIIYDFLGFSRIPPCRLCLGNGVCLSHGSWRRSSCLSRGSNCLTRFGRWIPPILLNEFVI